ncbi:hypothetical protein DRW48_07460 [Paracoccus suum]|uniref:Cytochrome c domain-containing protein n=1 Tax=Paracoccus suum TaxID=2259340 RepID=A0A344PJJ1_9RHOB|nr:c-type cytochrome [Paracoccus suum]AXC49546.1 hypothetical protein DRW48_07460 [Paracoccus suum]
MNRPDKQPVKSRLADEGYEPWENNRRIPLPVIWVAVALAVWGTATLLRDSGSYAVAQNERQSGETVAAEAPEGGEALFLARCSTCHQPNGAGVRLAVPPLHGSDFAKAGPEVVAQIMLRGIDGPIRVSGFAYDGRMPSFAAALNDGDIAQIASFVANRFGGTGAALEAGQVATLRAAQANKGSWQGGAELAALVPDLPTQPPMPAEAKPATDPAISALVFAGKSDAWSCASCHGDLGQGTENTPRLAGLAQGYIARQLRDFRQGERHNESMNSVAKALNDHEIHGLAAYYARQRVASAAQPALGGDLARGEQIALQGDWSIGVPACFSCHGPSGFGVAPDFPALAAQQPAYIASQLAAWAGGHRNNSPLGLMDRISEALPEADRRAVADYLASLPAVPAPEQRAEAKIDGGKDEL